LILNKIKTIATKIVCKNLLSNIHYKIDCSFSIGSLRSINYLALSISLVLASLFHEGKSIGKIAVITTQASPLK